MKIARIETILVSMVTQSKGKVLPGGLDLMYRIMRMCKTTDNTNVITITTWIRLKNIGFDNMMCNLGATFVCYTLDLKAGLKAQDT